MMVDIVEVGPRDGFQPIKPFIPTFEKIGLIDEAFAAGFSRIEVTAFVSPQAIPQLADAAAILRHASGIPGLDAQVLVPNARGAELALKEGAKHLVYVISVSEAHNQSNVRRTVDESIRTYADVVAGLPRDVKVRLNLATTFDCPFDGCVDGDLVVARLEQLLGVREDVEVGLCDTTGRAAPDAVEDLCRRLGERFGSPTRWAFHGHDTYGLGVANALAAYKAGVVTFDAAFGGLGGCPFAPGATGNTASEDLVYMFEGMGVPTRVDLGRLVSVATRAAALPGASPGGRVRDALGASSCRAGRGAQPGQ